MTATEMTTIGESISTGSVERDSGMMGQEVGEKFEEVNDDAYFVMTAIVGPIFCVFGLVGNLLSIVTWNRRGMRSSTSRYLTGQAVADFALLLLALVIISLPEWTPSIKEQYGYGVFYSHIAYPTFFFLALCSVWITVGVTVDRYIMVCWITKAKQYCNEKRANLGLFLIVLNCGLINLPRFASYTAVDVGESDSTYGDEISIHGNHSVSDGNDGIMKVLAPKQYTYVRTEFAEGDGGGFYDFWVHCIFLTLVPWSAVLTMNLVIIKKIKTSNRDMADKKSSQAAQKSKEAENQITRLLLTVTFTFLVMLGFQCICDCIWAKLPVEARWQEVVNVFAIAKTGFILNSSLNFILYCVSGKRFRSELMKVFGCVEKDSQLSSLLDQSSGSATVTTSTSKASSGI